MARARSLSVAAALVAALVMGAAAAGAAPIPFGLADQEIALGATSLRIYTYKPPGYDGRRMLLAFHGSGRSAIDARRDARNLGDKLQAVVVAPLFDAARFPVWAYQEAGITVTSKQGGTSHRSPRAPAEWTGQLVLQLIEVVRREEGRPDLPYWMIGHSAGAQFLGRFAAFLPSEAQRIVLANPSAYVAPTRKAKFPYGYGGLPSAISGDKQIRRYLAMPITVYLGKEDNRLQGLDTSRGAYAQGENRRERGEAVFREAEATAKAKGWPFGWRLVEVAGVGHTGDGMYARLEAVTALFPDGPP